MFTLDDVDVPGVRELNPGGAGLVSGSVFLLSVVVVTLVPGFVGR